MGIGSLARPRHLEPGNRIAVVSPSWGGPAAFPHVFDRGLDVLRGWGLEVAEFPSARTPAENLRADPAFRADDINRAFADKSIAAIIASIGGDDSIRLLPFLEASVIAANPKILMGFSDTTTLLMAVHQLGIVTFHGPSVMAGLSQVESLPPIFGRHVRSMLFNPADTYTFVPYGTYADGYPDWGGASEAGLVNPLQSDDGWHVVQGEGRATGRLIGGCLEVLDWLRGLPAWPLDKDWDDRLLFIETSEEKPTALQVARMLRSLGAMGIFGRLSGLLVGRARDHSIEEKAALEAAIRAVVANEFGRSDLPIVANLDFGHTDPQWVLPLGIRAELDVDARAFRLIEPWLS